MKTLSVITILALSLALSQSRYSKAQKTLTSDSEEQTTDPSLVLLFEGLRGFSLGFSNGLHKAEETSDCLSNDTVSKLEEAIRSMSTNGFSNVGVLF